MQSHGTFITFQDISHIQHSSIQRSAQWQLSPTDFGKQHLIESKFSRCGSNAIQSTLYKTSSPLQDKAWVIESPVIDCKAWTSSTSCVPRSASRRQPHGWRRRGGPRATRGAWWGGQNSVILESDALLVLNISMQYNSRYH